MTVVGKILAGLNLIFSVVVAAFAVVSYNASINHAQGFAELKQRYEVVARTNETYKQDNDKLRDQARTFREVLTKRGLKDADVKADELAGTVARRVGAVIDTKDSRIKELEGQLKIAKDAATKSDDTVAKAQGTAEASTEDIKRRQKEVVDLRLAMGAMTKKQGEL